MSRSKRQWFCVLGVVVVFIALTVRLEAQCAKCYWPPPYVNATCGNTFYNGANACVVSGANCSYLGSCQGDLGPCEPPGEQVCVVDRWACGPPLEDEWRLERYTIESPAARPVPLTGKATKIKA